MTGEVSVLGLQNHLAVWNRKRLQERLFKKEPFTEEDGRVLAEYGIYLMRATPASCSPRRWSCSP